MGQQKRIRYASDVDLHPVQEFYPERHDTTTPTTRSFSLVSIDGNHGTTFIPQRCKKYSASLQNLSHGVTFSISQSCFSDSVRCGANISSTTFVFWLRPLIARLQTSYKPATKRPISTQRSGAHRPYRIFTTGDTQFTTQHPDPVNLWSTPTQWLIPYISGLKPFVGHRVHPTQTLQSKCAKNWSITTHRI